MISQNIIQALAMTLVHSLWLGLIASLAAGIILFFMRHATAAVRYHLLTSILALFIISTVVTFYLQLSNEAAETGTYGGIMPGIQQVNLSNTGILEWCNANSVWISGIWFFVFCLRCTVMARDLYTLHRIRNHKVAAVPESWKQTLQHLSNRIFLGASIAMKESQIVTQPMVIGFIKPVILVPVGLLMQLPPDETEAILLHELAHIKRRDYLVNLLQSFAETLFFFNPALLWLSARIRTEREHCCDDIAIAATGNKTGFAKALVSFNEIYAQRYALAFGGRKYGMLERVQRIIYGDNLKFSGMEKFAFVLCIATGLVMLSFNTPAAPATSATPVLAPASVTAPAFNPETIGAKTERTIVAAKEKAVAISKNTAARKPVPSTRIVAVETIDVPSEAITLDTIPANASKEFIEGYNAAMRDQKEKFHDGNRRIVELKLRNQQRLLLERKINRGKAENIIRLKQDNSRRHIEMQKRMLIERKLRTKPTRLIKVKPKTPVSV